MKVCCWLIGLLFPLLSSAQISLDVQAGTNFTTPHVAEHSAVIRTKGGMGWQAGASAMYQAHRLFVYSGLGMVQYRFSQSEGEWNYNHVTYQPVYLQMPLGVGYQLPLPKAKRLSLYGGVQGLLGTGGKFQQPHYVICVTVPCPQPKDRITSDIDFGKDDYTSFAKTAACLQTGAVLTLTSHIAAGVSYAWSLTDVKSLPDDYTGSTHLRSWEVSVRYNLVK